MPDPTDPPPRGSWWSKHTNALIGAAALIIAAILGAVLPQVLRSSSSSGSSHTPLASTHSTPPSTPSASSRPAPPPVRLSINLRPRSVVPQCSTISGYWKPGAYRGKQLWLFDQIPNGAHQAYPLSNIFYFLRELRPDSHGAWTAGISLGNRGESGYPYWLEIVSSDLSLTGRINPKGWMGDSFTGLPASVDPHPLLKMEVIVGRENGGADGQCSSYIKVGMH